MNKIDLLEKVLLAKTISPTRNPYALCKELEIEVIANRHLNKDGYLVCFGGCKLIFVNSTIANPHRRRFVISHELGHFFLHQDRLYSCANISEQTLTGTRLNTSMQEREANCFASEFLLPEQQLKEAIPSEDLTFNKIKNIAKAFDVSVTFAAIKSVQLSNTENEILLCYDKGALRWFTSGDKSLRPKSIPNTSPIDLSSAPIESSVSNIWDTLYQGTVRQEIFSPYGTQKLILLTGRRLNIEENWDEF